MPAKSKVSSDAIGAFKSFLLKSLYLSGFPGKFIILWYLFAGFGIWNRSEYVQRILRF